MYFFIKKVSDNYNIALLSGVLYMIAPYHLTDLYVRNATGEFASFVFIFWYLIGKFNKIQK